MTTNIAKIRAVLESAKTVAQEFGDFRFEREADEALAALAELEKAAATPVAWRSRHSLQERWILSDSPKTLWECQPLYAAPPTPVAEIREVVVTREMWQQVERLYGRAVFRGDRPADGRDMIDAVQAVLGPALGLVELKEPTPEECERICSEYERLLMREGTCGGRDAFDAVRAVMWPKENGK